QEKLAAAAIITESPNDEDSSGEESASEPAAVIESLNSEESSGEESVAGPVTPPSATPTSSRALMAVFMCITFFSAPHGSTNGIINDGQGEGRALDGISGISPIADGASSTMRSWFTPSMTVGPELWAIVRTLAFLACLWMLVS